MTAAEAVLLDLIGAMGPVTSEHAKQELIEQSWGVKRSDANDLLNRVVKALSRQQPPMVVTYVEDETTWITTPDQDPR
jgi:hypothetical protein